MPHVARLALAIAFGSVPAFASRDAAAKAAYFGLEETVAKAETIAIVHTETVVPTEIHGENWTYRELVDARVLETIKGSSTSRLAIAASKSFICAPVHYDAPADYLVFLADDQGHLATVNHEWGALEITDGMVEWPYGDGARARPLADAVKELRALVGEPEREPTVEPTVEPPVERPPASADAPEPADWPAPVWIASGAFAVVLGMFVATRRRRSR